jgi:small subunit ribosomal protein S17
MATKKAAAAKAPKAPKKTVARKIAEIKARGRTQEVTGEVISDKMHKTISVLIFRRVPHPQYGKYVKKTSVFKAHDEKNEAKIGDVVRIVMCRPLSKTKRWKLREIVQKARTDLVGVTV